MKQRWQATVGLIANEGELESFERVSFFRLSLQFRIRINPGKLHHVVLFFRLKQQGRNNSLSHSIYNAADPLLWTLTMLRKRAIALCARNIW